MIVGLGTDIVLIDRVVKATLNKRFIDKYYSENEKKLLNKNIRYSASNFCAKEAFVKALGTGFRNIDLKEIEILRNELGQPYINTYGDLKNKISEDMNFFVSISHSDEYVTSTVIIERVK